MPRNTPFLLCLLCFVSVTVATEYVPVYMWETARHTEAIPTLDRISQDSFKDLLLERLTKNPFVVIFSERNLSPEDFAQHDQNGLTPFSNISELKSEAKVTYWPFVHNPIKAVKQLDKKIVELNAEDVENDFNVPKDDMLIVDLNDARENEDRLDMLRRHDDIIARVYKKVLEEYDNVLAFYTAHHTSWVVPEEVRSHRRVRSLLSVADIVENNTGILYNTTEVMLYVNYTSSYKNITVTDDLLNYDASVTKTENGIIFALTANASKSVTPIEFIIEYKNGYWYLKGINVTEKGKEYSLKTKDVYAPVGFSYHCTSEVFYGSGSTQNFSLPKFQLQAFGNISFRTVGGFGDAYDCVGFTSAPIWSGLFVTLILGLIMTYGLVFMMDIKTMDRFDDPKGKTITVNVTE